jgi:hypothetical protein
VERKLPRFLHYCSFSHSDYGFIENKFFPRICSKQIRILYIVGYKFNVIRYANEQGNRTAERHFGSPTTKKITCKWRRQEEKLTLDKKNHTILKHITQDSQSMYNVRLRCIQVTTVALEQ